MPDNAIWKGIFGASGAKIVSLITGIIALSITARWLGPEGRGQIVAVTTWTMMVATISHLSLGQVVLHKAAGQKNHHWLGTAYGSLVTVTLATSLLGWLALWILWALTGGAIFGKIAPILLIAGFLTLPFYIWESYGSYLLMAVNRLPVYNKAQVIGKFVSVPLLWLLIPVMALGTLGGVLAINLGQAVTACFGMRRLARLSEKPIQHDKVVLKSLLGGGLKLHFNAVGTILFTSAEVVVIQAYLGAAETGTYQLAQQLTSVLLLIPAAASMVIYSKIGTHGADGFWPNHKKLIVRAMGLVLLTIVPGVLLAPFAIPLVAGNGFSESIVIFQIMLLTLPGKSLSILMAPQWIGRGLFVQASVLTFLLGGLSLGGSILLTPHYGVNGVLGVSIFTYAVALIVNACMAIIISKRLKKSNAGTP